MITGISDILESVGKEKSRANKIAILQKNASPTLKMVLGLTYDPNVVWLLPEGPIPDDLYKPNVKEADMQGQMYSDVTHRLINHFIEGRTPPTIQQWKREKIFLGLLETLDPDDAQVVIQMKDRRLKFNGLTKNLVCEAFPILTQNWSKAE